MEKTKWVNVEFGSLWELLRCSRKPASMSLWYLIFKVDIFKYGVFSNWNYLSDNHLKLGWRKQCLALKKNRFLDMCKGRSSEGKKQSWRYFMIPVVFNHTALWRPHLKPCSHFLFFHHSASLAQLCQQDGSESHLALQKSVYLFPEEGCSFLSQDFIE